MASIKSSSKNGVEKVEIGTSQTSVKIEEVVIDPITKVKKTVITVMPKPGFNTTTPDNQIIVEKV